MTMKRKNCLTLLLALAMVCSLAACGSDADTGSDTSAESSASASSAASEASSGTTAEDTCYEDALACYEELTALSEDEQLDAFIEAQAELNYDGNTDEFLVTPDSSLVSGFSDAVLALDEYEIGMSEETSYGYFVVIRLPVSDEDIEAIDEDDIESIKEEYISDMFNARLSEVLESAEVERSDLLDEVDYVAVFEKLSALQADLDEVNDSLTTESEAEEDADDSSSSVTAEVDTVTDEELEEALLAVVPEEFQEDATAYLTDGVLTNDTVVLTVDGIEVPACCYMYFLCYNETYYASMYTYYYGSFDVSAAYSDDLTYADVFAEMSESYSTQYAAVQSMAEAEGVSPSEEDTADLTETLDGMNLSDMAYVGCNYSGLVATYTYSLYGEALQDYLYGEGGPEELTDEDAVDYALENGYYYNCRYILFANSSLTGS
ncbi:MAG: hypothetical protein LUC48_08510 [Clostridiales bacterium]|nr:hypothetical protein [Clostridiales bacterium]